jgi:hypothetical protein
MSKDGQPRDPNVWEEFVARMRECVELSKGDRETAHSRADAILCEALNHAGLEGLVRAFDAVEKWYA